MTPTEKLWTADVSLSQLTPYMDWDGVLAMIASLRVHLFVYGTIPTWNYMLCGGYPELATPFSWAYTWPSVFAYLFEPLPAVIAVWVTLTAVGFVSLRALLLRWTKHPGGSALGACIYVFSGALMIRFNAGQVTFAFYHLVPVMMLLFEIAFEQRLAGRKALRLAIYTTALAFLFFTSALPHGLLHCYPIFLALVLARFAVSARGVGWLRAARAIGPLLVANLLGAWLAAYKIWPAARWQMLAPRTGVRRELYSLGDVVWNTLIFVPSYAEPYRESWHVYPAWSYNAFVGPLPWLLAGISAAALIAWLVTRSPRYKLALDPVVCAVAFALVVAGLLLSLGNANPIGPGRFFRHLPVLDGVRAFPRYQILLVFGLAVLSAAGYALLLTFARVGWPRRLLAAVLTTAALAPILAQAAALVWEIPVVSHAEILSGYPTAPGDGDVPRLVGAASRWEPPGLRGAGHELALIERGYWIANCRIDLTIRGKLALPERSTAELTTPPPERIARLDHDSLTLAYPTGSQGWIGWNLGARPNFEFEPPARKAGRRRLLFDARRLQDGTVTVTARNPVSMEGALASAAGLVVGLVLLGAWARRGRGQ